PPNLVGEHKSAASCQRYFAKIDIALVRVNPPGIWSFFQVSRHVAAWRTPPIKSLSAKGLTVRHGVAELAHWPGLAPTPPSRPPRSPSAVGGLGSWLPISDDLVRLFFPIIGLVLTLSCQFLEPCFVLVGLRPALVSRTRSDKVHVGTEVAAVRAGCLTQAF